MLNMSFWNFMHFGIDISCLSSKGVDSLVCKAKEKLISNTKTKKVFNAFYLKYLKCYFPYLNLINEESMILCNRIKTDFFSQIISSACWWLNPNFVHIFSCLHHTLGILFCLNLFLGFLSTALTSVWSHGYTLYLSIRISIWPTSSKIP